MKAVLCAGLVLGLGMLSGAAMAAPDLANDEQDDQIPITTSALKADQDWSLKLILGYDSEYIIRGTQISKQDAIMGVSGRLQDYYAGAVMHVPAADAFNSYPTKIVAYGGSTFDLAPNVHGDVGFNGYLYPDDGNVVGSTDSFEPYMRFGIDNLPVKPSLYAYYDVVRERYTFEASGKYSIPLRQVDFVLGARTGITGGKGLDFGYAQGDAELVHKLNAHASIGVGAHVAASTENTLLKGLAYGTDSTSWFGFRLILNRP